ncbi:MAG: hypothetical protein AB7O66_11475 [Limisphaerales bacterium]
MKQRLVTRIQKLGQQAGRLRQVVEAAPAQAARLRENVVLTVGQLHQLRSELLTGITELRADSGEHLLKVLEEIRGATDVFGEAGFELAGVDLELGLNAGQRLLLLLRAVEPADPATIDRLARAQVSRPAVRGVLAALQRAVELAGTVDLPDLVLSRLTVAVGPVPTVRIGWRETAETPEPEPAPELAPVSTSQPPPVLSTTSGMVLSPTLPSPPHEVARSSVLTFGTAAAPAPVGPAQPSGGPPPGKPVEPTPPPSASAVGAPPPEPTPTPTPTPTPSLSTLSSSRRLGSDWRAGALDRFKKMPDLHPGS